MRFAWRRSLVPTLMTSSSALGAKIDAIGAFGV
jgi:hypothetical protein